MKKASGNSGGRAGGAARSAADRANAKKTDEEEREMFSRKRKALEGHLETSTELIDTFNKQRLDAEWQAHDFTRYNDMLTEMVDYCDTTVPDRDGLRVLPTMTLQDFATMMKNQASGSKRKMNRFTDLEKMEVVRRDKFTKELRELKQDEPPALSDHSDYESEEDPDEELQRQAGVYDDEDSDGPRRDDHYQRSEPEEIEDAIFYPGQNPVADDDTQRDY